MCLHLDNANMISTLYLFTLASIYYRSMEVVDYLLEHMSRTTAAYKELVDKENRLASDLALAQAQLFPLRKENSRLTRENHQLHLDNIRQQDEATNMFADQGVDIRKLKDKIADLQLVGS